MVVYPVFHGIGGSCLAGYFHAVIAHEARCTVLSPDHFADAFPDHAGCARRADAVADVAHTQHGVPAVFIDKALH